MQITKLSILIQYIHEVFIEYSLYQALYGLLVIEQ